MYSKMQEQHLFFTTFVLTAHIPFTQYRFTAFQISLKAAKFHLLEKVPIDFIFANDLLDTGCKMNGLRRPGGLLNVSYKFNLRPANREGKFVFFQHKPGKLTCGWVFHISNTTVLLLHFYFVLTKMFVETSWKQSRFLEKFFSKRKTKTHVYSYMEAFLSYLLTCSKV